jgi:hypothetical protein
LLLIKFYHKNFILTKKKAPYFKGGKKSTPTLAAPVTKSTLAAIVVTIVGSIVLSFV